MRGKKVKLLRKLTKEISGLDTISKGSFRKVKRDYVNGRIKINEE